MRRFVWNLQNLSNTLLKVIRTHQFKDYVETKILGMIPYRIEFKVNDFVSSVRGGFILFPEY